MKNTALLNRDMIYLELLIHYLKFWDVPVPYPNAQYSHRKRSRRDLLRGVHFF